MYRNTFIFVALLAVVASLVVGVQIGRRIALTEKAALPTPTPFRVSPTPTTPLLYTNNDCGIQLTYPSNLQQIESSASGTIFANIESPTSSVIFVCQAEIPRVPLPPEKIETLTLSSLSGGATISAKLYHDTSQKDGTAIDKLIFTNPKTGMDVFIGGFGEIFNTLIKTVKLL